MIKDALDETIDNLFQQGDWHEAEKLLRTRLEDDPENHWLLTQLGVTYYERRQYQKALKQFVASLKIVPDCPLTLWNLAGTLDSLGRAAEAVPIFKWLLESPKSAAADPCWESSDWTQTLKTDCVYRLGICLEHLKNAKAAELCYRQYVQLLLDGMDGSYPVSDVLNRIRHLNRTVSRGAIETEFLGIARLIGRASGKPARQRLKNGRGKLPLDLKKLLSVHPN